MDLTLAFEVAREAERWEFEVSFGEDLLMDENLHLAARAFNMIVIFHPPNPSAPSWHLSSCAATDDPDPPFEPVGEVTVAQVIDAVPGPIEPWVLAVTEEVIGYYDAAAETTGQPATRAAAMRLRSEREQAEAHSARWSELHAARYGDGQLYDFPPDAELVYRRGEEQGRPALFFGRPEDAKDRVLVAPDTEHPWRYSAEDELDVLGEQLTVTAALERATPAHAVWVHEQTALALGDTLAAIREVHEAGLDGRQPPELAKLARLALHAHALAEGLEPPLAGR